MNINSSLPLLVNRPEFSGSRPVVRNTEQQVTVSPIAERGVPTSSQTQQISIFSENSSSSRDRVDLRVLNDPSLSLPNQQALAAYETTANFNDTANDRARLDISV